MRYLGPEAEILHERYARALVGIADGADKLDEIKGNFSFVTELMHKDERLLKVLTHPEISRQDKAGLFETISGEAKFCGEFNSFLKVLIKRSRLGLLEGIFAKYCAKNDEKKHRLKVYVDAASGLDQKQLSSLKGILAGKFGMDINIEQAVDPSLAGGFNLRVGSRVYNFSLASRLDLLKKGLRIA
ncbi:MAG: ATP synthase F1 subunit delta, partial [Candidatus Omnitrophota bacterium]